MRGVRLAADAFGNFLLIGDHGFSVVAGLIEGKNIKECQCIITNEMVFAQYDVHGQGQASDDRGVASCPKKASLQSRKLLRRQSGAPLSRGDKGSTRPEAN